MNNEGQIVKKQETKKTKSSLEGVVCSNTGTYYQPVYKRVYDKELDASPVKCVDKFNLFDFIQASKSQTDLALLEKRYIELGEIPSVDSNMVSGDFANYPDNIHEVYKMANDIAGNFAKLPESIQNIFGTKEAYMKALIDGTYQATLINAVNNMSKAPAIEPESEKGE